MASVLYAWELGAGLGHVGAFVPLAGGLQSRGHTVHWAVCQPAAVGEFLAARGFACLPAPSHAEVRLPGAPLNYSDILLRYGYQSPSSLMGLVLAWRGLMQLTGASAVVADHAPTAMLAARTLGLPVMLFSFGFSAPPCHAPLPAMRSWVETPSAALMRSDAAALFAMNAVLTRLDAPPLHHVGELFDVAEPGLLTFPELDHYAAFRGAGRYWGALPYLGEGDRPDWPALAGPRLFGYLRAATPRHMDLLEAVAGLRLPALVYFPDAPPEVERLAQQAGITLCRKPLDLRWVMATCDAVLGYASSQTTAAALLAGKPLLMLPWHLEQFMLAARVAAMGAGIVVSPDGPVPHFTNLLRQLLGTPSLVQEAQRFAQRYLSFRQEELVSQLVDRLEAITSNRT